MVSVGLQLLILVCTAAVAVLLTRQRYMKNIERLQINVGQGEYENQRLLQEIDQRLKDNMQTVISLTNLEYRRTKQKAASGHDALRSLQGRFNAMAIVQRALSNRVSATTIAAKPMISDLVKQYVGVTAVPVETTIETNNLELDALLAGPLGMIIHETYGQAVTAIAGEQGFLISVELNETEKSQTLEMRAYSEGGRQIELKIDEESLSDEIVRMMCDQMEADMDRSAETSYISWTFGFPRLRSHITLH